MGWTMKNSELRDDPADKTDKPFIVKTEKAFGAIRHWLKERDCNTYSWSDGRHIQVGYDF